MEKKWTEWIESSSPKPKEVDVYIGENLEKVVERLKKTSVTYGQPTYCIFNGVFLNSDFTMDAAHISVYGITKSEYDQEQQKLKEKQEREFEITNKLIAAGEKVFSQEKDEEWSFRVWNIGTKEDRMTELVILSNAFEIICALENDKDIEEVKQLFSNQGNSEKMKDAIREEVIKFSRRGIEFYKATIDRELSYLEKMAIEFMQQQEEKNIGQSVGTSPKPR